jgi:hypothetical protein
MRVKEVRVGKSLCINVCLTYPRSSMLFWHLRPTFTNHTRILIPLRSGSRVVSGWTLLRKLNRREGLGDGRCLETNGVRKRTVFNFAAEQWGMSQSPV